MAEFDLRNAQEPLTKEYEKPPEAARITLRTGTEHGYVRSCNADIGRAISEAELHEGTGDRERVRAREICCLDR